MLTEYSRTFRKQGCQRERIYNHRESLRINFSVAFKQLKPEKPEIPVGKSNSSRHYVLV